MVVALDATPLTEPTGGVRRYTEEVARALAEEFPEDTYHLVSDQPLTAPASRGPKYLNTEASLPRAQLAAGSGEQIDNTPSDPQNLYRSDRRPRSFLTRRWWLIGVQLELRRICANVFHGTDFSVPYLPLRPSVLTLHDLSPWMSRDWHTNADRVRRRTPVLIGLGIATMIITPSEAIRTQAIDRFRIHPGRVVAVPEAAAPHFRPVDRNGSSGGPYFLYVGTLEPRKNLDTVVEAWKQVRQRHEVELVLAGRRRADFTMPAAENGLRVLGEIRDEELPALYSGAIASLYPSLYEGFGLPLLEAMQCGAPVITSRDPALYEVSGGAAIHVDATDTKSWAAAMELMIIKPDERDARRERSLRQARVFSWAASARATHDVYLEAIRRFES